MGRDEIELNLELSIGGRYGEAEESKGQFRKFLEENADGGTHNCGDVQRRREAQAMRRQEARRKREEKTRKARGQNGVFAEDRLLWEAQKLQARAQERESRERDCLSEERGWRSCSNADDLSLSLSTENRGRGLYPKVQQWNGVQWGRNVCADSENSNGRKTASLEQCSSAISDYQSMSHRGGCSSDTGSHSSLQPHHHPTIRTESDQRESHDSWSPADADQAPVGPKRPPSTSNPQSTQDSSFPDTNNASSTSGNLSRETSSSQNAAASMPRMPCVSATGNGPNARTVMGFLYKYTKTEVSIVCVCHGRSFSPAAFVEHAGGVDISQPLRHITVVPTALR